MRESRLADMEAYIRAHRSVSLDTLCQVFDISKNTVRRDVSELVARTDIRKIYGGVSIQQTSLPPPFVERAAINQEAKMEIGRMAARLVADGDIIYIDSGTTTCNMVDFLQGRQNVTILTNSLDVINRAAANPGLNVIALPGVLNRKTLSFTGPVTIEAIKSFNISKAFMAANGITPENGATQSTPTEFAMKKAVVKRSDQVYLMAESGKFGVVSLFTYCPLERFNLIITDTAPSIEFTNAFRSFDGEIICCDQPEPN